MSIPKTKYELEYSARLNVIYHELRERLYSRLNRWSAFFTILLSSAAVASLSELPGPRFLQGSSHAAAVLLGIVITLLSAAALSFDWNGQLIVHANLKAKWTSLVLEAGLHDEKDRVAFEKLLRDLAALNAEEPPVVPKAMEAALGLANRAFGITATSK